MIRHGDVNANTVRLPELALVVANPMSPAAIGCLCPMREAAFDSVDADPERADHPVLRGELDLLFTEEDEGFLAKS